MLIIAGHLVVAEADRDAYVAECVPIVEAARSTPGCLHFSIAADTVNPTHVLVLERWEDEEQLLVFRGSGPVEGPEAGVVDADVKRYVIASVGEP